MDTPKTSQHLSDVIDLLCRIRIAYFRKKSKSQMILIDFLFLLLVLMLSFLFFWQACLVDNVKFTKERVSSTCTS